MALPIVLCKWSSNVSSVKRNKMLYARPSRELLTLNHAPRPEQHCVSEFAVRVPAFADPCVAYKQHLAQVIVPFHPSHVCHE